MDVEVAWAYQVVVKAAEVVAPAFGWAPDRTIMKLLQGSP